MYIRHKHVQEDKVLVKIANDLQWKLSVTMEYNGKGTPKRNQLAKLRLSDIAGKARAIMVQANMPEEIKFKLYKECFNCTTYLSN